jgi:hypothetical protein
VKLIYDKQKQKTQILKHAEDANWKEMFMLYVHCIEARNISFFGVNFPFSFFSVVFFSNTLSLSNPLFMLLYYSEVVDDTSELVLEVWTKSGLTDKLIGSCHVCIPTQLQPEELIDRVIDLELPSNLKSKHKEQLDSRMGNVHLRMIYSREHEIPIRPAPNQCSIFHYRNHYRNMQTGDLILYSGVGSTDSLCKLLSGTRYSRVGLVVRIPNKWTGREKLFVYEVTRNLGKELDAFKDTNQPGASLFRLFEHLHAVSSTDIWWVPLKMPLEQATCANMVDWIKETVSRKINVEFPSVPAEVVEFFDRYELSFAKHPLAHAEICSASAITAALRLGGKRFPFEHNYLSCVQLMSQECFGDPIIIRERNGTAMPSFYAHREGDQIGRSSSSSMRRSTIHISTGSNGGGSSVGNHSNETEVISPNILASGNTVVAPKIRPISAAVEPPRVPSMVAIQRQDASPSSSFSSQHMINAPEVTMVNGMAPTAIQPSDAYYQHSNANTTPIMQSHQRIPSMGQEQNPEETKRYRAPSNGSSMPIAPPGPSVIGLPNFGTSSPAIVVGEEGTEEGFSVSSPPAYNTLTSHTKAPSSDHSFFAQSSSAQDDQATTPESGMIESPLTSSRNETSLQQNEPSSPHIIIEDDPALRASPPPSVQQMEKSPSNSDIVQQGPPPTTAPKPKPKFVKEQSRGKKNKDVAGGKLRPVTAKPGSLANLNEVEETRDRAVSSGAKPRLLPAPSGRNVVGTMMPSASQLEEEEDSSPPSDLPPPKPTITLPQINLDNDSLSNGDDNVIISPRSKRSKKSPRSSEPSPKNHHHHHTSPRSPDDSMEMPEKARRKKSKKRDDSIGGDLGTMQTSSPVIVVQTTQGGPPPVPEKKKKSNNKHSSHHKRPTLAHVDAVRDDLDEGTKSELRKRRAASVRIMPESDAASAWNAAVSSVDHQQKQQQQQQQKEDTPNASPSKSQEAVPTIEQQQQQQQQQQKQKQQDSDDATPTAITLATFAPKQAMVLWTFDAMSENELTVNEGEKVTVLGISEEWTLVESNGKRGAVPISFLSIED